MKRLILSGVVVLVMAGCTAIPQGNTHDDGLLYCNNAPKSINPNYEEWLKDKDACNKMGIEKPFIITDS